MPFTVWMEQVNLLMFPSVPAVFYRFCPPSGSETVARCSVDVPAEMCTFFFKWALISFLKQVSVGCSAPSVII